jgi:aminoglycoside 3-N-acetyltransferase
MTALDHGAARSEASLLAAATRPWTRRDLVEHLRALGVLAGAIVIVHASLSSLGWVVGGAQTVVDALLEALGDLGTLVMPSQSTQLTDPARWKAPPAPQEWWDLIRNNLPGYDPLRTPTRGMGAIAEVFRTLPETIRSSHPFYSFCASGPMAHTIVDGQSLEDGLGEQSPAARLYDLDASVLLLGVSHAHDTVLHLAEHRCDYIGKEDRTEGAPLVVDGASRWVWFRQLAYSSKDFAMLGDQMAVDTGAEREGPVGSGRARMVPVRVSVDYAATWFPLHRPQSLPPLAG